MVYCSWSDMVYLYSVDWQLEEKITLAHPGIKGPIYDPY